jgi:hypothetical protein
LPVQLSFKHKFDSMNVGRELYWFLFWMTFQQ